MIPISMTPKLPIFFAPLQGFTDAAYRKAHQSLCGGVDAYFAPFVRLEHGEPRRRDLRDVEPTDVHLIPQVIVANVEEFNVLVHSLAGKGYHRMDINMGCAFPMQTRLGRGVGLMTHSEQIAAIMDEVKRLDRQDIHFSVKMRLGMEKTDEWKDVLPILNDAPLTSVTVHPRTGKQQDKGEVDRTAFAQICEASAHPVIYNGDIVSVADVESVAEQFPQLAGIMLGRGLLARPTLAEEYKSDQTYTDEQVRNRILSVHSRVLSAYEQTLEGGPAQVLQKILPFWEYSQSLFDHRFIKQLKKSHNLQEYKNNVAAYGMK